MEKVDLLPSIISFIRICENWLTDKEKGKVLGSSKPFQLVRVADPGVQIDPAKKELGRAACLSGVTCDLQ